MTERPAIPRRRPRWSELRPLLRTRRFEPDATKRRLARAATIDDLRTIARRRTPRAAFDYTDGAAEAELSLRRARSLFRRLQFNPSVLRDVSKVDTATTMLGRPSAYPFAFAPTGFTRMMQHEGERAVVRVAERTGIPYGLSTLSTTSIEDVAAAGPDADKWFQLYIWTDRSAMKDLINRARAAGYTTLMLTVDVPVAGARLRDVRNGFTIPPTLTPRTIVDMASHPAWWLNLLTTEPLTFASLSEAGHGGRADQPHVRPDGDVRRPRLDARELVRAARHQGDPERRRRPEGRRPRCRRGGALQPRRPPARPGAGAAPAGARGHPGPGWAGGGLRRHRDHDRGRHRGRGGTGSTGSAWWAGRTSTA